MFHHTARRGALAMGVIAAALSVTSSVALAQNSLEDAIRQLNATDVKGYTQPLADALQSNLSSGYFATSTPRSTFGFSLELVGLTTSVTEKMRTYTANAPQGFTPSTFTAPTVFGGKATPVEHSTIPGLSYRTSDGILDSKTFPTPVPQVRVSFLNTEVVARYIDSDLLGGLYPDDDFPKLTVFGIAARHGISQYIADLPVDIAVSGSYNSMSFGDYAELSGMTFGANVGKNFGILSGMVGIESTGGTMNLSYESTNSQNPANIDVDLETKRHVRFTAGATLNLSMLKLFGTASMGDFTTYSAGLRIGL